MDFSAMNGPPGTSFIRKNVMVATKKIVTAARTTRLTIYFTMKNPHL
jgi:hypothetical protein